MQKKLTWFLTFTALALFAFIFFLERRIPSTAERSAAPRVLPGIEPLNITALEITLAGGGVVRAEQTNGAWLHTKPLYPAHQTAIETFVTNLVQLRSFDRLPQHEIALQGQRHFGLEPPRATVQVETATNKYTFEVGGNAPLTNNVYLRLLPSGEVVLAHADLVQSLPESTNAWRSQRLLQLANIPFDHLHVRHRQRIFELGRNPTNQLWRITRPIPARGDQQQIGTLLDQLARAQVTSFIADGSADLERFGLQTPELEIGFIQGTNRNFAIEFGGAATNLTNQVYARLIGRTNIVTVAEDLVDFLKQPYKAFHDPRLMTFDNLGALNRIEVNFQEQFAVQRQADERWRIGGEDGFFADRELLGEFLSRILALRILDIAKEVPTEADLQELGLQKPLARYAFFERRTNNAPATTNLTAELAFGTNTADRIHVKRSDEPPIYVAELARFLELPRAAYELRERQIWTLSTGNITRVSIISPGATNTAVRAGAAWSGEPVVNEAIGEAVFRLSNLKALRWVPKSTERKRSLNIGTETLELDVKSGGDTQTHRIPLGRQTMRRDVYAEHPDVDSLVFEFPGDIYHLLKQNLPPVR